MKIIDVASADIIQQIKFDSRLHQIISLVPGEAKVSPTSSVMNVHLFISDLNEKSRRVSKIYKYIHEYKSNPVNYTLDVRNPSERIKGHLQSNSLSGNSEDQNLSLLEQKCKYFEEYYLSKSINAI